MPHGPHSRIPTDNPRDQLLARVLDALWDHYRERVSFVRQYEDVIAAHGATFVNDHIAFRTLAGQQPLTGIVAVSRPFEALGYVPAGCYQFPDKHLSAIHFQHPNGLFPKLFISELQAWKLSENSRRILARHLAQHGPMVSDDVLVRLHQGIEPESMIPAVVDSIHILPWDAPSQAELHAIGQESQYAAWVLVHGYNVNHFTALINSHGVPELNDVDRTVKALRAAGIPMKTEIEGAPGSKLRQTATEAVVIDVSVRDGRIPWSYAYFELAERGDVIDPDTGRRSRFEGFLGPQATQLFDMTRVR